MSGTERPPRSLSDVGEFGLIDECVGIADALSSPLVDVGPGDDAAVVRAPDGRVVVTSDLLVEGRHFRSDWSSAQEVGRRAAAANLADVAAMGATCTSLVVGFGAPADLPAEWALDVMRGIVAEAATVGAVVVGGDVVRSSTVVIAVTALGDCAGRAPVLRSGSRPGDVVAVAGRLGWAAAGLAVLSRGFRSPRALVEAFRVPESPYGAGPAAAEAGATAMIDVSDGLVADAGHVAKASGVVIAIETAALEVSRPMADAAAAYNLDPLEWVLAGGDDHALLATFPADVALPSPFARIGTVAQGEPGVLVDGRGYSRAGGFDHFR